MYQGGSQRQTFPPKILTEGTKRPLFAPHHRNTCKGVTHKCDISLFLVYCQLRFKIHFFVKKKVLPQNYQKLQKMTKSKNQI